MKGAIIGLIIGNAAALLLIGIGWAGAAFVEWRTLPPPPMEMIRIALLVFGSVGCIVGALSGYSGDDGW